MIVIRIDVWLIKGLKQNNIKTVYFVTGYSLFTVDTLKKNCIYCSSSVQDRSSTESN